MENFLDNLSNFLQRIQSEHPNINSGGCGFFAATLASHLAKHFPTRIRVSSYSRDDQRQPLQVVRENIQRNDMDTWHDEGVYFSHVVCEFDFEDVTYQADASEQGVSQNTREDHTFGWPFYDGHFLINDMYELATAKGCWNSCFNRNEIPAITRKVQKFFEGEFYGRKQARGDGAVLVPHPSPLPADYRTHVVGRLAGCEEQVFLQNDQSLDIARPMVDKQLRICLDGSLSPVRVRSFQREQGTTAVHHFKHWGLKWLRYLGETA